MLTEAELADHIEYGVLGHLNSNIAQSLATRYDNATMQAAKGLPTEHADGQPASQSANPGLN